MTPKHLAWVNQYMGQRGAAPSWQYLSAPNTSSQTYWTVPVQSHQTNATTTNAFAAQVYSSYYGGSRDYARVLPSDWAGVIELPDGSKIIGRGTDGITIEDKDAVVKYRAATRDFNRFLNASDIVEDFMRYAGSLGARRGEVLDLPLKLFIGFLLIEAAQADGEPPPLELALPAPKPRTRCVGCGRFMLASSRVAACNGSHLDRYLARATQ